MQLPKIFHETYITYLQRVNDLSGQRAPLKELLGLSQTQLVKNLVDNARNAGKGTSDYKKFKNQLPVCVIGGTFDNERPVIKNLEHPSGLLPIDIDGIVGDELERTLEVLQKIPNIILTQKSVSGAGCWAAFWYNHNKYQDPAPLWNFIYDQLASKGIFIDKQCKDVYTRKRFICSDEFWINPSPTIFDNKIPEKYYQTSEPKAIRPQRSSNVSTTVTTTNSKWHFGDKTNYDGVPLLGELVRYLWGLVGKDEYFKVIQNLDIDYKQKLIPRLKRWGDTFTRKEIFLEIPTDSRIWLDENIRPLIQISDKNSNPTVTLKTTYLSESKEFIKTFEEYLNNNNIFILQAPTGTGKTNFIREYAKDCGGLVLTHTRSLRANYTPELTLIEYCGENPSAAVMTYDRFVINYQNISDKVIFIDESHELFNTGGYRENPWLLLNSLPELSKRNKIILVSATPGYLNDKYTKLLVNTQNRKTIPVRVKHFPKDSREAYLRGVIRKAIDVKLKKTVIYSDQVVRNIMENFEPIIRNNVELHHSKVLREYTGDDFIEKPVALCTSLVCNGINFNNTEEIDVYMLADKRTTAETIIQFVGRFRKSKHIKVNILYFDGYHIDKSTEYLQDQWAAEDETSNAVKVTEPFKREFTELNNLYLQTHGGWENILKELPREFFIIKEKEMEERSVGKGNKKKIEISQNIYNNIEVEYNEIEYIRYRELLKYKEKVDDILSYRDVKAQTFLNLLDEEIIKNKADDIWEFCKTHPISTETVYNKICSAIFWSGVSKELFEKDMIWFEQRMKQTKDPKSFEMLKKRRDEEIKNFEKYSGKSREELADFTLEEWEQHFLKKSKNGEKGGKKGDKKGKSKGGKKGDKKGKSKGGEKGGKKGGKKGVEITINGKTYPTKKAAADALGVKIRKLERMLKENQ